MANFLRKGVVRAPVSPTSANTQISMPQSLVGVPNLTFFFKNANPFDVRLEGTLNGQPFAPVTDTTGWLIRAYETTQIYGSKMPVTLSAMAVATAGNPLPEGAFDYTGAVIELIYGTGGNGGR
jgi:hypothetical protein